MELFTLLNEVPTSVILLVYITVELIRAVVKRKADKESTQSSDRDKLTDSIFRLYGLAKDDIESEKLEIKELTLVIKKAHIEIAILERKVAALMRVVDIALAIPEVHNKYKQAMEQFKIETEDLRKKNEKL